MFNTYPGISFHGRSVVAIAGGRKTQTRRALNKQPTPGNCEFFKLNTWYAGHREENRRGIPMTMPSDAYALGIDPPRFTVGQWCYVREAWRNGPMGTEWRADHGDRPPGKLPKHRRWRSGRYLSRAKARYFIRIAGVWLMQLKDMSDDDAIAEGVERPEVTDALFTPFTTGGVAVASFAEHWDGINLARGVGWATNPWVYVYQFVLNQGTNYEP